MSTYKITGTVTYLSGVETFGNGRESKRVIVETNETYPNFFPVSFYGDRIKALDGISQGDVVEIDTYPGGRLKKGDNTQAFAYFNGSACMVVHKANAAPAQAPTPQTQSMPKVLVQAGFGDDVPF